MKYSCLILSVFFAINFLSAEGLPPDVYPGLRDANGQLFPSVAPYLGKEVRIINKPLDLAVVKKRNNFGYTEEEIKKYFSVPVRMVIDDTGLDTSFIKPPPAPGIHPRVFFNPEDLPGLRERLTKTQAGQAAIKAIRDRVTQMITGPTAKFGADYQSLIAGNRPDKLDNNVAYCLMYEAFRCLVDDDKEGGKKVAAAITTFSQVALNDLEVGMNNPRNATSLNDARVISQGATREFTLGLDYDFAYNFMTPAQRNTVREVLVKATTGMTTIGCETLQALHCGPSNWISWSCRALFALAAIEGEPGYDAETYQRFANAQINFINAIYATGEAFEGWGKNFLFFEHLILMAKRDKNQNILGHTSIRAVYNDHYVHAINPWGNGFTFCDSLARSGCKVARNADVMVYHALFPKDLAGNFIYRNQISSDYEQVGSKTINTSHPFSTMDALVCAIFATDLDPISPEEEFAQVTKNRPLTSFNPDTCNMFTRSAWDKNATYLHYLNRAIPGGHQYSDRSHFNFYSHGRFWSIYQYSRQIKEQYRAIMRSVVMADDLGPTTAEAKCVQFIDAPLATFEATDLSNPWNFEHAYVTKPPANTEMVYKQGSYNDFRLKPSPVAWMSLPIAELPHWYSSEKPGENDKPDWYRRFTVPKAFRTVGLVRGAHPYGLILDDLQIDDQPHKYLWAMTMATDILLSSAKVTSTAANAAEADIILAESDTPDLKNAIPSEKKRHLLVRVLSASQLGEQGGLVETVKVPNPPQRDQELNRLHIPCESVSPAFKILLFPHLEGEPLPTTKWNANRSAVTLTWADQTDVITFTPGADGRTRVKIDRAGTELIRVP